MTVDAVQTTTNTSKKMSYLGSMAIGAMSGYVLKWALPVSSSEKDEIYNSELAQIQLNAKKAGEYEIEAIKKEPHEGIDEFIKLSNEGQLDYNEIKNIKEPLYSKIKDLFARVSEKIEETKYIGEQKLTFFTKGIRPASAFIFIGTGIGLTIALINNIIQNAKNTNNSM